MKVNFSREIEYVPEFNGNHELPPADQLVAKLKPMTLLDLLDLTDVLKNVGFDKGDVKDLSHEQMKTVVTQGGKYIPKYVTISGADGFDLSDVTSYATFAPLATELLFSLINKSSPSQADVKN